MSGFMHFKPDFGNFRSDFKVFRGGSRDFTPDFKNTKISNFRRYRDFRDFGDFRYFRSDFRTFVHRILKEICPSRLFLPCNTCIDSEKKKRWLVCNRSFF